MDKTLIASLNQDNQDFLNQQVTTGKYSSHQAVLNDALEMLRKKQESQKKKEHLHELLMVGIRQAEQGKTIPYSRELIDRAFEQAQKNIKAGKPIRDEIKP